MSVGLALILILAAIISIPPLRAIAISLLLLPHFFPGDIPRPLSFITPSPTRSAFDLRSLNHAGLKGDLYLPSTPGRHPAMILMLGVNPLPRSDDQVRTLAEGITRTGIVVAVAESQALNGGEIHPQEVDNLVALFEFLEQHPQVDRSRVGFAGFCVGAVLQLLAASDDRIANRVAYVNAFSVYADPLDVLQAILTNEMPTPDGPQPWFAAGLTRTVFLRHAISMLPSQRDRDLLTSELLGVVTLPAEEIDELSPWGLQIRELLSAADRETVALLLSSLPRDFTEDLRSLAPIENVSKLQARTFLMHDRKDTYLPVSGARTLHSVLPVEATAGYTEFQLFDHVTPAGIFDIRFMGEVMLISREK